MLYQRVISGREVAAAALLQATLLFVVDATTLGRELALLTDAVAAALVAAALLSTVNFPLIALGLLCSQPTEVVTRATDARGAQE